MLIGSNRTEDFERPEGYTEVEFSGNPQENYGGERETNHADRSVEEALRLADSRQFSMIFFNRTMSTVTGQVVQSNIRPDVYGVLLPDFRDELEPIGRPVEIMSGRQFEGYKDAEYARLGVHRVIYKVLLKILLSPWNQRHVRRVPIRLTHTPTTYRFRGVNRRVAYGRSRPHRIGIPAIAS